MQALRHSQSNPRRRGGALAASLIVVMLMAMLSAAMLSLRGSMARRQLGALDAKRAFYVAEAGLAEGAASLAVGGNGNVASQLDPARFGDGIFWTEAQVPLAGYSELTATAMCGTGRCTLQMVVRNAPDPIGSLGMFGNQTVAVGKSAVVDGIDSDDMVTPPPLLGLVPVPQPAAPASAPARVASNGSVTLTSGTASKPTMVSGDVVPGVGRTVTAGLNTQITGSTAPASAASDLPVIAVPSLATVGAFTARGGGTKTLPSSDGRYTTIRVQTGTTLTIAGPAQIVASSLQVDSGGTLQFKTDLGAVELYVENSLVLASGSNVASPTKEAKSVSIYHLGDPSVNGPPPTLTLAGSGDLYAKLYAPHLAISLPSTLQTYGAVVGQSVSLASGAKFHYDVATAAHDSDEIGMPSIVSWQLLEMPESTGSLERVDPIKALGLDAASLRKPADSYEGTDFVVTFVNKNGRTYTYVGEADQFDWSGVDHVVTSATNADPGFLRRVLAALGTR